MEAKRWILGLVLAAAVGVFGLMKADASPFWTNILSDDLGNMVRGNAAEASEWDSESGGGDTGGGSDTRGGADNNGHGNNADGVDSSNPGKGNGGPNGGVDESCPEGGTCVDDEVKGGSDSGGATETPTDTGAGKGKKK